MPKIAFTADKVVAFITALLFFLIPLRIGIGLTVFVAYAIFFILWKHKHIPFILNPTIYGVLGLFAGFLLSSSFSQNPELAFLDWHTSKYFALPFLLVIFCADHEPGHFIKYSLWSAIPYLIYIFTGSIVAEGEFLLPGYFGEIFLLLLCLSFPFVWLKSKSKNKRLLFVTFNLLTILFLLSTQGAFLKIVTIYALALFLGMIKLPKKVFMGFFVITFIAMLSLAHQEYSSPMQGILSQKSFLSDQVVSAKKIKRKLERENAFKAGRLMTEKNPILGVGANQQFNFKAENSSNLYIKLWLQYGIIGLLGFLFWFGYLLFQGLQLCFKNDLTNPEKTLAQGVTLSLIAFLITEYYESYFFDPPIQVMILASQGMLLSLLWNKKSRPDRL